MKKIFLLIIPLVIVIILVFFIFNKSTKNSIDDGVENNVILRKEYEVKEKITVPILIYHNIRDFKLGESVQDKQYVVSVENFDKQIKYLSEN